MQNKILFILSLILIAGFSESFFITTIGDNATLYTTETNTTLDLAFQADTIVKTYTGNFVLTNATGNTIREVYPNGTTVRELTIAEDIESCTNYNNKYYCSVYQIIVEGGYVDFDVKVFDYSTVLQDTITLDSTIYVGYSACTIGTAFAPVLTSLTANGFVVNYNTYHKTASSPCALIGNSYITNIWDIETFDLSGNHLSNTVEHTDISGYQATGTAIRSLLADSGSYYVYAEATTSGITDVRVSTYVADSYDDITIYGSELSAGGTLSTSTRGMTIGSNAKFYYINHANATQLLTTDGVYHFNMSYYNSSVAQGIISTQTYYTSALTTSDIIISSSKYSAYCKSMGGIEGVLSIATDKNGLSYSCVTTLTGTTTETINVTVTPSFTDLNQLLRRHYTSFISSATTTIPLNFVRHYEASTNPDVLTQYKNIRTNTDTTKYNVGYDVVNSNTLHYRLNNLQTNNFTIANIIPNAMLVSDNDLNIIDYKLSVAFFTIENNTVWTGADYSNYTVVYPYNSTHWAVKSSYMNATGSDLNSLTTSNLSEYIDTTDIYYSCDYSQGSGCLISPNLGFFNDFDTTETSYYNSETNQVYAPVYYIYESNNDETERSGFFDVSLHPDDSYISLNYSTKQRATCTLEDVANGLVNISAISPEQTVFYSTILNTNFFSFELEDDIEVNHWIQELGQIDLSLRITYAGQVVPNAFCTITDNNDNARTAISTSEGHCNFANVDTNTFFKVTINPQVDFLGTYDTFILTGDYYNTQRYGSYHSATCDDFDGTIKYDLVLDQIIEGQDILYFYVRDSTSDNAIMGAIVTIDDRLNCITGIDGICTIETSIDYLHHNVTVSKVGYYITFNETVTKLTAFNGFSLDRNVYYTGSNPETAGATVGGVSVYSGDSASEEMAKMGNILGNVFIGFNNNIGISVIVTVVISALAFTATASLAIMIITFIGTSIVLVLAGMLPFWIMIIYIVIAVLGIAFYSNRMIKGGN